LNAEENDFKIKSLKILTNAIHEQSSKLKIKEFANYTGGYGQWEINVKNKFRRRLSNWRLSMAMKEARMFISSLF